MYGIKATTQALEIANQLIEAGVIGHVFFSTESARLQNLAKDIIKFKSALFTSKKTLVDDSEGRVDSIGRTE